MARFQMQLTPAEKREGTGSLAAPLRAAAEAVTAGTSVDHFHVVVACSLLQILC